MKVLCLCMVTSTITILHITNHLITSLQKNNNDISSMLYKKTTNFQRYSPFYHISYTLQRVGCDDVFGSGMEMDACGVCGGNSSCGRWRRSRRQTSSFRWTQTGYGECSSTCGVGNLLFHVILLINCYLITQLFCENIYNW